VVIERLEVVKITVDESEVTTRGDPLFDLAGDLEVAR
jgi:hypothetical protein